MPENRYEGDPLDQTWQDIKDRPFKGRGKTVEGTPKDDAGSVKTDGVDSALNKISQDEKFDDIDEWITEMRKWDFDWRQEIASDSDLPQLVRTCVFASILHDMNEYGARVDKEKYARYSDELNIALMRLFGDTPFHKRQYIGDPSMHSKYEEFITDTLPKRAPDPLNQPVER